MREKNDWEIGARKNDNCHRRYDSSGSFVSSLRSGHHLVWFTFSTAWHHPYHLDGSDVRRWQQGKTGTCQSLLSQFDLIHLTSSDQDWAMQQMEEYRLSHGVATGDCFIASVANRLQLPLYTHNLKDMSPLIGKLALKPYP